MNQIKNVLAISVSCLMFAACNQTANNKATVGDSVSTGSTVTGVVLKDTHINSAYVNYVALKDALVASDADDAKKAASKLSESLSNIEGCANTASLASKISNSADLAEQRKSFTPLSSDLIALMKHADVERGTLFVQYCPMANAGKGAYWMASNKEIKNPYYGEEMLTCGEVTESISKK